MRKYFDISGIGWFVLNSHLNSTNTNIMSRIVLFSIISHSAYNTAHNIWFNLNQTSNMLLSLLLFPQNHVQPINSHLFYPDRWLSVLKIASLFKFVIWERGILAVNLNYWNEQNVVRWNHDFNRNLFDNFWCAYAIPDDPLNIYKAVVEDDDDDDAICTNYVICVSRSSFVATTKFALGI